VETESAGPVRLGVLGPVAGWAADGAELDLKGPRHRAVLARLAVARGRVVPLSVLVDDLWEVPPAGAAGAVRTFVGALRRAIEPGRSARAGFQVLVTRGPGYALLASPGNLDSAGFERLAAKAADAAPARAVELSGDALGRWRGPAYAGFADEPWASGEAARLTELRLSLIERQADARLALGLADQAAAELGAHVSAHPWREDGWRLLALALYRAGRQAEALDVTRRARSMLAAELGLDPGPALAGLEAAILRHDASLGPPAGDVLAATAAAYQRAAPGFTRTRLESAATLASSLALTGGSGLQMAMSQRLAAIEAAEQLDEPALTAQVIGNYDVPASWTRSDDPAAAARIVAAAERTLAALPPGRDPARARLLATIAIESRGSAAARPGEAAAQAEAIARRLGDPALLAFALNGTWMQSFWRTGLARRRDAIGAELVTLASRHGLVNFEVLGRLIRLQALSGLADFVGADTQARVLDQLAQARERPGVTVFTRWYQAMRGAMAAAGTAEAEDGYRQAAALLHPSGMPGVARGLLPLALLCLRTWQHQPAGCTADADWGPYLAWALPWRLLARDRPDDARQALSRCPAPPPGLLAEALWSITARAAVVLGDHATAVRAYDALLPARDEIAGAASGMLTAGPVSRCLSELEDFLAGDRGVAGAAPL
jgi:DNA-binding SARP family transcriptional activator